MIDTETGETREVPWLTMAVDSPMIPSLYIQQFLETVPGYGTEFQVEYELINPSFMVTSGSDGKPAEDPDEAFRVLDRLLSEDVQRGFYITSSVSGVSVCDGLGASEKPMGPSGLWMNEENYESFRAVRKQISDVKFYSLLDREAMFTVSRAYLAQDAAEDSVKSAVHKAYTAMQMMLAES